MASFRNMTMTLIIILISVSCKSRNTSEVNEYESNKPDERVKNAETNLEIAQLHHDFTKFIAGQKRCYFDVEKKDLKRELVYGQTPRAAKIDFNIGSDFKNNKDESSQWLEKGQYVRHITLDNTGYYHLDLLLKVTNYRTEEKQATLGIGSRVSRWDSTGRSTIEKVFGETIIRNTYVKLGEPFDFPIKETISADDGTKLELEAKFICE